MCVYILCVYSCASHCAFDLESDSHSEPLKKNHLINWDYWYAKPVLEISDESANVFTVVNDK